MAEDRLSTADGLTILPLGISPLDPITREQAVVLLERMEMLNGELKKRKIQLEPLYYGAPDLMFPKNYKAGVFNKITMEVDRETLPEEETDEDYHKRQDQAIYDLVTKFLTIVKDSHTVPIRMIPKQATILADLFYGRISKLILWGPRGGGKSLLAAIFIWISFVYLRRSCLNLGGAGDQAKRVYDYTKQFWANFPGSMDGFLEREPLLQKTEMKNGSVLVCATSTTSAIGQHIGTFVVDEAASERPGADHEIARAMQGALSEPDHRIFLLSTFHIPTGIFADVWDRGEEMGFTRMRWDIFDSMEPCEAGLECATDEDPQAIESFCKTQCPLSWQRDTYDEFGNVNGQEWIGCLGKARESRGWYTREQVLEAQRINQGTRIFECEFVCIRPVLEGRIYNRKMIDACVVPSFGLRMDKPKVIGIDWGLTQCAMVLMGEWIEDNLQDPAKPLEGIGVVDVVYMSNKLVDAVIDQIRRWQERFGDDVLIRADGSHPYCNRELGTHGYRVIPVFGDRKLLGQDNLARWLGSGLFRILDGLELFMTQMHNLRRNTDTGKQLKQNLEGEEGDHGPDATKFAAMSYDYVRWAAVKTAERQERLAAQMRKPSGPAQGSFNPMLPR